MSDENETVGAYLRRDDAAQYVKTRYGIPCTPQSLAKYACCGGGPIFRKAGRWPLYTVKALDEWVGERLSGPVRSTSELSASRCQSAEAA